MHTGAAVELLAEALGFLSASALAWQAYRLVRHLRTVHQLREAAQRQAGRSADMQERAERTAQALEQLITRWDAVDYRLVLIGLIGLALSFVIKLAWIALGK
jgi:hypothetical protein